MAERDSFGRGHFAAHRKGCPTLERLRQRRASGIRLELVDAPDEARAVEASRSLDAGRRLGVLAGATPDVGVTDEANSSFQDACLPGRENWQLERLNESLDIRGLPAGEAQDLRRGVRGFCPRRRLARKQFEGIELCRMVGPQAKQ